MVFTPDGHGGYSRSAQSVAWEEDIGDPVADGAEIPLQSFMFDFANQRWGSFFVSRHGLLTFGAPHYQEGSYRFNKMRAVADEIFAMPTISVLFKPYLGGRSDHYGATQHVARWPDRVVITWSTTDPYFYVHDVPPERPFRFQAVLGADGSVGFNYADVAIGDGIVGLFLDEGVSKGDLIAHIQDARDSGLPGHLDLVEVAIYEDASSGHKVIVEFVVRSPMPTPGEGTVFKYRAYFDDDLDQPFADGPDFFWQVNVGAGNEYTARNGASRPVVDESRRRISFLVDLGEFGGTSGAVAADAFQEDNGSRVHRNGWTSSTALEFPEANPVDLSRSDNRTSRRQSEVFHYRDIPDLTGIACRVIDMLGDEFDLFVFHSEFRLDAQAPAVSWKGRANAKGIGDIGGRGVVWPCGDGRLKGHWNQSLWMKSFSVVSSKRFRGIQPRTRFDRGLALFAHEFTHSWTAHASYDRNGERVPLFDDSCGCHWRSDFHLPAAFPWNPDVPGPSSLMGGRFWRDNGNGSFTHLDGFYVGDGHSWLDLYMMGLADASEVPDMFILRNLKPVNDRNQQRVYTGDKEIVTIQQVVAAEGPRVPSVAEAQKDFNAAFVYLLEPGQTPDPDLLRLHAEYRDQVIEHWSHVTGGRSRDDDHGATCCQRLPMTVGTLGDQAVPVGGVAVADVGGAFRDPDGDPRTYEATSSAPAMASLEVSGVRSR